jgi:hypothetical protein
MSCEFVANLSQWMLLIQSKFIFYVFQPYSKPEGHINVIFVTHVHQTTIC